MNTSQAISTFIEFFRDRGHRLITGASLIPAPGDPVLFTTSGMHPLTPFLEGRPHPLGNRLTGVQRCLRTTDLDEVGDYSHLTLFQMLGSWSLGDYSGPQSLRFGYELVRDGFGIPPGLLHATVFGGDEQTGPDAQSQRAWDELGVPVEITSDENWWTGPTGLCGTDSELFVWTGELPPRGTPGSDPRWVELWNHVSLRYQELPDGTRRPLRQRSVDTGMGLERLLMVLQHESSVFGTDLFRPWMSATAELWPVGERESRIIVDHLRSGVVIIGDGVRPSNTGRGYVLRRLLRRALTTLWRDDPGRSLADLPDALIGGTLTHFQQATGSSEAGDVLLAEERRFRELLTRGRRVLSRVRLSTPVTEQELRDLHQTHGLPPELVSELLAEQK
ncbi:MAG: hypothetical protein J2P35_03910 [Actinobacteria bacterium]|nr:hypothetical protein [Actinomycetota bacterium]